MVGDFYFPLCRWDIGLTLIVEKEVKCCQGVPVGYVGMESDHVYGDKQQHPIFERRVLLAPLLDVA